MLVAWEYRATAHQLWGKATTTLQKAKDQLEQLSLAHSSDVSSGSGNNRNTRHASPESPPLTSGSNFRPGAVVVHPSQGVRRSPPRQPPELPSGSPPSRHQSMMQGARGYQQRSSTQGDSSSHYSGIVPGGRRDYSPDRLPSRKSTRTTQKSTSADFDRNSWQRSKVSFSNPENHYSHPQQSPDLVESPEQDESKMNLQQQRPPTTPSRSGKGNRHGSNHMPDVDDDDENEMHHKGATFGNLFHHADLQPRTRKGTQSSTATTTTDDSSTPVPTPKVSDVRSRRKKTTPSKKPPKPKEKEPKQEKPSLSVAEAITWKQKCQEQPTIGFGVFKTRLGAEPDLQHGYLRKRLERRDHVSYAASTLVCS